MTADNRVSQRTYKWYTSVKRRAVTCQRPDDSRVPKPGKPGDQVRPSVETRTPINVSTALGLKGSMVDTARRVQLIITYVENSGQVVE